MSFVWKTLLCAAVVYLCVHFTTGENDCTFPSIDRAAQANDVLGDLEKSRVCALARPERMCEKVDGKLDKTCVAIARAIGGVTNVTCSHLNTCAFLVRRPVQHPNRPGTAYVSLCRPDFIGVIFPCIENNLIIADPYFRDVGV